MISEKQKETLYQQVWKILDLMKKPVKNEPGQNEISREQRNLISMMEEISELKNNVSAEDVVEFFYFNLLNHQRGIRSLESITFDDLKKSFDEYLLAKPTEYDFYFKIGRAGDFPDGYQLGNGIILSYEKLPEKIKTYLLKQWEFTYEEDKYTWENTPEDYEKRKKNESYMYVRVESTGYFKAEEKAFIAAKRNANILKLILGAHNTHFSKPRSPFYYCWNNPNRKLSGGGKGPMWRENELYRVEFMDDRVAEINTIINNTSPSKLEKKILNVIDIHGLIDDETPLHVSFLLCIICLESLLLDKSDEDHLGSRLAEKLAFLIGNSKYWYFRHYNLPFETDVTDKEIQDKLVESRIGLERKIRDFYDKRSGFAHSGLSSGSDEVTEDDYSMAGSFLRLVIEKLLKLTKDGITHIASETKNDEHSLDFHIKKMKYETISNERTIDLSKGVKLDN